MINFGKSYNTANILCIICQLSKPGRLGDTADELPTIQNGSKVADLVWDPFDNTRLVVGQCNSLHTHIFFPACLAPLALAPCTHPHHLSTTC